MDKKNFVRMSRCFEKMLVTLDYRLKGVCLWVRMDKIKQVPSNFISNKTNDNE